MPLLLCILLVLSLSLSLSLSRVCVCVCVCVCPVFNKPVSSSCAAVHLQLLFLISQKLSNGLNSDCLGFLAQAPFRILIFLSDFVI